MQKSRIIFMISFLERLHKSFFTKKVIFLRKILFSPRSTCPLSQKTRKLHSRLFLTEKAFGCRGSKTKKRAARMILTIMLRQPPCALAGKETCELLVCYCPALDIVGRDQPDKLFRSIPSTTIPIPRKPAFVGRES